MRRFHASLHYHLLAQLDLGRDAANIYAPADPRPDWADALQAAYLDCPGTIALQVLPLRTSDLAGMLGTLDHGENRSLDHPAGHALATLWAAALRGEMGRFGPTFRTGAEVRRTEGDTLLAEIGEPLQTLNTALWALRDKAPPPLTILDVRALGRHARGGFHAGEHVVAASLAMPVEHVLCQVFHECCHPISDRMVGATGGRETRADAAGFAVHQRLESAAVELGARAIEAVAPELRPAYQRWCNRG